MAKGVRIEEEEEEEEEEKMEMEMEMKKEQERREGGRTGRREKDARGETERRGERDVVSVGAAVLGYSQIGGHRQSMT